MRVADNSQGLGTVLSGVQGTLTGGGGAAQGVRAFIGWMAGPPRAAQAGDEDEDEDDGFATPDEDEGEGDDHGAKAGGGKGGAKSEGGAGGGGSSASNASCSNGGDGEGGGGEASAAVTRAPEAVEGRAAAAPPQEVEMGPMRPPPKLERFHSAEG